MVQEALRLAPRGGAAKAGGREGRTQRDRPSHRARLSNRRMVRFPRRQILAAVPFAAAAAAASPARLPIRRAVEFSMLPAKIPVLDRFQMARDAGFEAIECPTTPDAAAAEHWNLRGQH